MKKDFYVLNWTRGICATLVVLGHARFFGVQSGSEYFNRSFFSKIALLPTSFAMESVSLFFVLSGFLVGGQTFSKVKEGKFSWKRFLIDRVTRFWIVLIPGMAFTAILNFYSEAHLLDQYTYSDLSKEFMCNVALLMPMHCQPFMGNSSLWSLGYEFYFYILFAGAINFILGKNLAIRTLGIIIAAASLAIFGVQLIYLFPAWLLGFLLHLPKRTRIKGLIERFENYPFAYSLAGLIVTFIVSNLLSLPENATILFCALPSALFVKRASIYHEEHLKQTLGIRLVFDLLGEASFSVYVFHLPLIYLLSERWTGYSFISQLLLIYFFSICAIFVCCILFFAFESQTPKIRTYFYRFFKS